MDERISMEKENRAVSSLLTDKLGAGILCETVVCML